MATVPAAEKNRQAPERAAGFAPVAERFRRGGDLERAVKLCREGLARFPEHLSGRVTLGWALLDLGRYDEARTELELVLRRAPDNLAAIRGLAELHDRAESTMTLDVGGPGPWPPEGAELDDDPASSPDRGHAMADSAESTVVSVEAVELVAMAPPAPVKVTIAGTSEVPVLITAAQAAMEQVESPVEPAAEVEVDLEVRLEAAIADLDAQADAIVAGHASISVSTAVEAAEAERAEHITEESQAVLTQAHADAAREAEALADVAALAIEAESETGGLREAGAALQDLNRSGFEEASSPAMDAYVQARDEAADLGDEVQTFAEAIEPADLVVPAQAIDPSEPLTTAAARVDDCRFEVPEVELSTVEFDLVPEDAERAVLGAERLVVDLEAAAEADVIEHEVGEPAVPDLPLADAFAAMEDLTGDGRLIEPLTHNLVSSDPEEAVEAQAGLDVMAALYERHADAHAALGMERAGVLSDPRDPVRSSEPTARELAGRDLAAAYAEREAVAWTPPTVEDAPALPFTAPPMSDELGVTEATEFAVPEFITLEAGVEDAPMEIAARPEAIADEVGVMALDETPVLAMTPVYDDARPSDEVPEAVVEPVARPAKGRVSPPRKSPIAQLERMLRRVRARRQVVSESLA